MGLEKPKFLFLLMATVGVCTLAFYIHRHQQGRTGYVDNLLISVTGALQRQVSYFSRGLSGVGRQYVFLVGAQKKSEALESNNDALRSKLTQMEEIRQENLRLKEALGFKNEVQLPLIAASVIAQDVSVDYYGLRIDKGKDSGVRPGMGVISKGGVVGRVLRVGHSYADVRTLIDPNSHIDVVLQRSRARGILTGQSKQLTCKIRYLDRLEDVQVGDTVVSSGFNEIFPVGLLAGEVTAVIPNPNGVLQSVVIKSAVDIYRLEEVFIVFPRKKTNKVS